MNTKSNFSLLSLLIMLNYSSPAISGENAGSAHVIKGQAEVVTSSLFTCENGQARQSPVGIKKYNDIAYIVPAETQYQKENFATDLYNECSNVMPKSLSEIDMSAVPIIEIDSDGEIITGYLFADNYFELFINNKLVGVDSIPFTPFNSNIVRFKVKKPYDIAVKVVDWEENSGLGSERNRGKAFHPGDGGFIASFSDGTVTNADWAAQTFYISPVYDLKCPIEIGQQRLTKGCSTNSTDQYKDAYSLHWDIPDDWQSSHGYLSWPNSMTFSEDEIGVNNKNAYMNFQEQFSGAGASFIWSSNLVLDNLVLFRYRVE